MPKFLQRWLVNTLAVLVAANVVRGIHYDTAGGLIVASLLLGVFNAIVRPVLLFLSLPLVVVSLGLFVLVINALLLRLVAFFVLTFHVDNFSAAFWGALVIALVSMVANVFLGGSKPRRRRERAPRRQEREGNGPIIDV